MMSGQQVAHTAPAPSTTPPHTRQRGGSSSPRIAPRRDADQRGRDADQRGRGADQRARDGPRRSCGIAAEPGGAILPDLLHQPGFPVQIVLHVLGDAGSDYRI